MIRIRTGCRLPKIMLAIIITLVSTFSGCSKKNNTVENWGFELGTLGGWDNSGAFEITLAQKYNDFDYYIHEGVYHAVSTDSQKGTLKSGKTVVNENGAIGFLLAGTADENIYVDIIDVKTKKSINRTFVEESSDTYQRIVIELNESIGKEIYIMAVDNSEVGHLNIDDVQVSPDQDMVAEMLSEANYRNGIIIDEPANMLLRADIYSKQKASQIDRAGQRPFFHFTGMAGWINDPNGFSFYNGKIHLFYQSNPYKNVWGPMHWGHATTEDFVKWEYQNTALAPDMDYDSGGAFSGSAIEYNGKYYLVYTGNAEGAQVQCVAQSTNGLTFQKIEGNPVIDAKQLPANTRAEDFRDPKVWEKDGKIYMIVSAKNKNDDWSKLLLYHTQDMQKWTFNGTVLANNPNYSDTLGRMFECPDLFTLSGKDVIIASPQTTTGHRNADSNVYMVGNLNYTTGKFENFDLGDSREIDRGFDFYAPQTMQMPDGRRVMVAWMATWNRTPVTAHIGMGFAGMMTFPRELTLKDGRLYQNPVSEISQYHTDTYSADINVSQDVPVYCEELRGKAQDITLSFTPNEGKTGICVFDDGHGKGLKVYYQDGRVYLDRTDVTENYYNGRADYKVTYADAIMGADGKITIRLLIDKYSCEVFVSGGYSAITATALPSDTQINACIFSDSATTVSVTKHNIKTE